MDSLTHLLITQKLIGTHRDVLIAGLAPDLPFYLTCPLWLIIQGQFIGALRSMIGRKRPRGCIPATILRGASQTLPHQKLFPVLDRRMYNRYIIRCVDQPRHVGNAHAVRLFVEQNV